jgi:lipoprotein signal peptidase
VPRSPSIRAKALMLLTIVAGVCALDQATKALALKYLSTDSPTHVAGPLYLVKLVHGTTSFSNIAQSSLTEELIRLVLIIAVAVLGFNATHIRARVLCALVIGGTISNALDHWTHPAFLVVDFIKVGNIATFNIADVTVALGIVGLAVCFVPFITHPRDFVRVRHISTQAAPDQLSVLPL